MFSICDTTTDMHCALVRVPSGVMQDVALEEFAKVLRYKGLRAEEVADLVWNAMLEMKEPSWSEDHVKIIVKKVFSGV